MSSLAMIDQCILYKLSVYVVGWEHLGAVIVTRYSFDLNMGAFIVHFRKLGNELMEYQVLITPEYLPRVVIPATKAGKILFGYKK